MSTGAESEPPREEPSALLIAVGRVGPAHGLRGDVYVEPLTDDPDDRFTVGSVFTTDPAERGPLTVESAKYHKNRLLIHFRGVEDRTPAEDLRGTLLTMPATARPPLDDPDDFYDTDLIGLSAVLPDGAHLGTVTDVIHPSGTDYLVIEVEGSEKLIPFVKALVPTVDLAAGRVVIDPPPGLLDL